MSLAGTKTVMSSMKHMRTPIIMNFAYSLVIRSWTSKLKQRRKMGGRSFTYSNRKAWSTSDHLASRSSPAKPCQVSANSIALVMVNNGKWKDHFQDGKSFIWQAKAEINELSNILSQSSPLSQPLSIAELSEAIRSLKNGKVPGNDNIHTEPLLQTTTDQVTHLINNTEAAFQRNEKFGTVFIDLTAAYDTVWHKSLYLKLLKTLHNLKLIKFLMVIIQDNYKVIR